MFVSDYSNVLENFEFDNSVFDDSSLFLDSMQVPFEALNNSNFRANGEVLTRVTESNVNVPFYAGVVEKLFNGVSYNNVFKNFNVFQNSEKMPFKVLSDLFLGGNVERLEKGEVDFTSGLRLLEKVEQFNSGVVKEIFNFASEQRFLESVEKFNSGGVREIFRSTSEQMFSDIGGVSKFSNFISSLFFSDKVESLNNIGLSEFSEFTNNLVFSENFNSFSEDSSLKANFDLFKLGDNFSFNSTKSDLSIPNYNIYPENDNYLIEGVEKQMFSSVSGKSKPIVMDTATNISFGGITNNVTKEVDINEIINSFASGISNALATSCEGVYL